MVKDIIHDPILIGVKSETPEKEYWQVTQDLIDTLIANKYGCFGMVANMIGFKTVYYLCLVVKTSQTIVKES